jgi:hypothetical protein
MALPARIARRKVLCRSEGDLVLLGLWQLFVRVYPAEISVVSNTSYIHSQEAAQSKFHYLSVPNLAYLVWRSICHYPLRAEELSFGTYKI